MYLHIEDCVIRRSDCTIQALSWMGKVPDSIPDEDGWRLDRINYYQEGWLSCGNSRGIIGVTFTACHYKKNYELPPRTNFNLRGHRSEVILVKWNEPYQKLATCDVTGVIFVWIKHEGRWSIELINDRNSQVTDFSWSHDGRMALICYRDGFVLVGSVAGQRYWSSMLNLDDSVITNGIWSPDDQRVMFATTDGQIVVMSANGTMLSQVSITDGLQISSMAWSCEKFYLTETPVDNPEDGDSATAGQSKAHTLVVSVRNGTILLMTNYDDPCPKVVHTGLTGMKVEWSNDGEMLVVGGFIRLPNLDCRNEIRLYTRTGVLRYQLKIPQQSKPVTALTWGHNDRRLFIAAGCYVYTVWVSKRMASLQLLSRRCVQLQLRDENLIHRLPLPTQLRHSVAALFTPTIKGYIPEPQRLREFVSIPPPMSDRLHCTMIRHGEDSPGAHYTLYLEYLGGLVPLLKGKRASKLRPEFVIFDPKIRTSTKIDDDDSMFVSSDSSLTASESDDETVVDGCGSPRMKRRRRLKKWKIRMERRDSCSAQRSLDEMLYDDNLPECSKLVEITSNIWGTKFKIHGLASFLAEDLGQVLYKTSLLHLQPRQMTVDILEVSKDLRPHCRDPTYNPNHFSESEDEINGQVSFPDTAGVENTSVPSQNIAPILPETGANCHAKLANQSSLDSATSSHVIQNGPIEVAVTVEKPSLFPSSKSDKLAPVEIRTLDSSPPQRRSPSYKAKALSPAEHVAFSGAVMVDGHGGESMQGGFTREILLDRNNKLLSTNPYASVKCVEMCDSRSSDSDHELSMQTLSIVQMAAKKLENVLQQNVDCGRDERLQQLPRWADKACEELKYIDDDTDETDCCGESYRDTVHCCSGELSAIDIMRSSNMLTTIDNNRTGGEGAIFPSSVGQQQQRLVALESQAKRLVLSAPSESAQGQGIRSSRCLHVCMLDRSLLGSCGSIDEQSSKSECSSTKSSEQNSPILARCPLASRRGSLEIRRIKDSDSHVRGRFDLRRRANMDSPQCTSLPTSPVRSFMKSQQDKPKALSKQDVSNTSLRLQSSLTRRKLRGHGRAVDSSDDEVVGSADEILTSENYKNLETFQKAQLNRKLKKVRTTRTDIDKPRSQRIPGKKRHFVMYNKAPMWNENSQVYQLDFGGRVTQESAKNFQIEFRGKQVMQFGRIDTHAYTLDFQYPFSAIQAFAVALANVTQRLK